MQGVRKYTYRSPLLIRVEEIHYLDKFLSDNFETVKYAAGCVDGTKFLSESLDDLLEYENPSFKRVDSLNINATSEESLKAELRLYIGYVIDFSESLVGEFLRSTPQRDTAGFELRYADINWGIRVERELIERLEEFRPWYWWLNKVQFTWALPLSLSVLSLVLNGISLIQKLSGTYTPGSSSIELTSGEGLVLMLVAFLALFGVGVVIDSLRDYLFPGLFFCLGKQAEEFKRRQRVASLIFGVIILGIILEIVGGFVANLIF